MDVEEIAEWLRQRSQTWTRDEADARYVHQATEETGDPFLFFAVTEDGTVIVVDVEQLRTVVGSGGTGDSWWELEDGSIRPTTAVDEDDNPIVSGVSLNDLRLFYRQPGDLNHSMGWGYIRHGVDGPVLNGFTGGGFAVGDATDEADVLVGEWRSDGLYSLGSRVITEDSINEYTFSYRGVWEIADEYPLNSVVQHNGSLWVSLIEANVGHAPDESPTQWAVFLPGSSGGGGSPAGPQGSVQTNDGGTFAGTNDFVAANGRVRIGPGDDPIEARLLVVGHPLVVDETLSTSWSVQNNPPDGWDVGYDPGDNTQGWGWYSYHGWLHNEGMARPLIMPPSDGLMIDGETYRISLRIDWRTDTGQEIGIQFGNGSYASAYYQGDTYYVYDMTWYGDDTTPIAQFSVSGDVDIVFEGIQIQRVNIVPVLKIVSDDGDTIFEMDQEGRIKNDLLVDGEVFAESGVYSRDDIETRGGSLRVYDTYGNAVFRLRDTGGFSDRTGSYGNSGQVLSSVYDEDTGYQIALWGNQQTGVFIYDTGADQTGPIYNVWADLVVAANESALPVVVVIRSDQTVPPGTWDFSGPSVTFTGGYKVRDFGGSTLTFNDAVITNDHNLIVVAGGLTITTSGSEPPFTLGDNSVLALVEGASLVGGTVPVLRSVSTGPTALLSVQLGSQIITEDTPVVDINGGVLIAALGQSAQLGEDTVSGTGALIVEVQSPSTTLGDQPSFSGFRQTTYRSLAANVAYPDQSATPLGVDNVGDALDALAERSRSQYVYEPSAPSQTGDVFNDWAELMAASSTALGRKTVIFTEDCSIPAGTWDLTNTDWAGTHGVSALDNPVTVTLEPSAELFWTGVGFMIRDGVAVTTSGSTPPITIDENQNLFVNSGSAIIGGPDSPAVIKIGAGTSLIHVEDSVLGDGEFPAVDASTGVLIVATGGTSIIDVEAITGGGLLVRAMNSASSTFEQQTGHSGILVNQFTSRAERIAFATGGTGISADTVQGAIAELDARTAITAGTRLVYNSSGPEGPTRFTSWSALAAAVAATPGRKEVLFEQNETIPAGTWDMTDVSWLGNNGLTTLGNYVAVTFAQDAFIEFDSYSFWIRDGIGLTTSGTTTPFTLGDNQFFGIGVGSAIVGGSDAPVLTKTGSGLSVIAVDNGSLGDGTLPAANLSNGSTVVATTDTAFVNAAALTGGGMLIRAIQSPASTFSRTQPGHSGMAMDQIASNAGNIAWDNSGTDLDAETVAAALTELANSSSSGAIPGLPTAPSGAWFQLVPGATNIGTAAAFGSNTAGSQGLGLLWFTELREDITIDAFSFYINAVNAGANAKAALVIWEANGGDYHGPGTVIPTPGGSDAINGVSGERTKTFTSPVTLKAPGVWWALVPYDLDTAGTNPTFWVYSTSSVPRFGWTTSPPNGNTRLPRLSVTGMTSGVGVDNPTVVAGAVNTGIPVAAVSVRRA